MGAIAALGERGMLINVGNTAGTDVELPLQAMRRVRSSVVGLSSGWTSMPEKVDAYRFVIRQLASGAVKLKVDTEPLDSITPAWSRQEQFPHQKIVIALR
jgi:NADPH:quinone reductase-like Zn-dependent oxidoreductase